MLPLLVATFADSYWDRYSMILASSMLYAAGLLAVTSTALKWPWLPTSKINSVTSLSCSLYMISLGQGGYNPSLQAFGADQLEEEDELPLTKNNEKSSDKKSLFFQWWYFGICCGSLLGVSVMSYIQDNFGWGLGFAIPTLTMVASIVMFLLGSRFYIQSHGKIVDRKSFGEIFQSIKAFLSKMIGRRGVSSHEYTVVELELQEKESWNQESEPDHSSFEQINLDECISPLQAVKAVLRLMPIWLTLLQFAVIFQQPATFFTKQGMTMKRNIGSFKIPPAALQSAITISIIVLMPWYNKLFIPFVRFFTRKEEGITVTQRMGIGMVLSVIAMAIAALTERKRLEISRNMEVVSIEVPFSIFWLLPQYILLGFSDIFTVIGMQEFFYSEVPMRMKTMGIALYTSVFGVGSYLSVILISLIEWLTSSGGENDSWCSDDMAKARLDNYYWFLAFSSSISFFAFVIFCKFLKNRT
ncbi:hypothetical protein RD792_004143 [Penstemon davidsonii]|uniref:Uncharacterized protein n=1 Tax=Penstemon davidsonii TaxID=160366 RepID=A0ABR0DGL2_9LAMI|nr:hypothetical protein RD792_004143 [Penstemon davidsonii]